ncbi:PREDICTED: armadillo repeat-containing protein 5 [Polistes dominula]|uniref:Armadillo repeat-containing protein 5 n=1 Tax=Polistes dominula TaxID=743375 RepID=A0ABM1J0I2_POLDO|nr:PREDICTED: armadillo repeat-containing protein 5 [Polistes dominula]
MSSPNEKSDLSLLIELSKYLKVNSKSGITNCLARLKTDSKCYRQFVKDGGLTILIKLLRSQDLKILNMTLSLLANACLISDAREEVKGTRIGYYIICIMKKLKSDSAIQCRACRLIGNLSECSWHAKSLYEAGSIQELSKLLQSKTNTQTYLMVIRAIRNIWSMHEGCREDVLDAGIIKNITGLLIIANNKAIVSTKYTELVEVCLKAMCAFLICLEPRCGIQMQGEKDLEGYKCIVDGCSRNNKLAIKCLCNLSQIAECRPNLGSSGAIEILISLMEKHSKVPKELLASLCMFCRESVNRAKIRNNSGLELILTFLKKNEMEQYHPTLLLALAQFIYDDQSILIMINNGLFDVLNVKLKKMVENALENRKEQEISTKRNYLSSSDRKISFKYLKSEIGRFSVDYPKDDWSPCSSTSFFSSPSSTPPLPFYDSAETDENAEDNYSPVCSDTEWENYDEEPQEEVESLKSCKSLPIEDDESRDSGTFHKFTSSEYTSAWTLALLNRLSLLSEPIEKLVDPKTIGPLSSYIRYSKNYKASKILTRILRNSAYLIPLVKQGFAFEAQTLYGSEYYTRQLCALGETGGIIGELTSILIRGEDPHKTMVAISIPFIIKSKTHLKFLLNNNGGLKLILNILNDREHALNDNAVWSICQLANTLQIRPEFNDKGLIPDTVTTDYPKLYESLPKPSIVTFELDDGSTVDACRKTLCQKSDAFSAMLEGNFSESGKRRVKLKNTSKEGLNVLISVMNGATLENTTIESLLDAALLADKFLMSDITDTLTASSIAMLSHENFSRAWNWARNNSCYELKTCCVKRFLSTKMSMTERIQAFREFSNENTFPEFLDDIKEIINSYLCQP